MIAVVIVVLSTICNAFGSVLFKKASARQGNIIKLFNNYLFLSGILLYAIGVMSYAVALKYADISLLYPIAAMQYVWVGILATKYFNERMNIFKWSGIILIIAGASFIGIGL